MTVEHNLIVQQSVQIARDYLEGTGEIDDDEFASRLLNETVERQLRRGITSKLILANIAIREYQNLRQARTLSLVKSG